MVGAVGGSTSFLPLRDSASSAAVARAGSAVPSSGPAEAGVSVSLSPAGLAAAAADRQGAAAKPPATTEGATATPGALSPEELRQVDRLKARDRAVRAHEQAHQAAAGGLASGGASYTLQRGPDGVDYAIGGEVPISLREGRTPEETIANARTIRAAALAPADPSPQDRAVAAAAGQMEARAQAELAQQKAEPDPAGTAAALASTSANNAANTSANTSANNAANTPASDAAVERRRAGLADLYGLIAASSAGFAARA